MLHDPINLADVDMGTKEPELVTTEENKGSLPTTQAVEVQIEIPQTTSSLGRLSLLEEDTSMEETLEMTVSDLGAGIPTFLTRFDSLEFNSLLISHFYRFGPPCASFLRFFVLAEGLPLLEGLLRVYGDFTNRFKGDVFFGNILMKLLCVVLVSLKSTSLDSLSEERLLEWRGVV